jgi:hypothetical protein
MLSWIAAMKSLRRSHVIVVDGQVLATRLRRMAIGRVTMTAGIEEARCLCRAAGVDACLVVIGDAAPDAAPQALADAPGRPFGIPAVIVAPAVTPYLRKAARLSGYAAVLPAKIVARMLYRRIGAVLQGRRRQRASASGRLVMTAPVKTTNFAKPTVH